MAFKHGGELLVSGAGGEYHSRKSETRQFSQADASGLPANGHDIHRSIDSFHFPVLFALVDNMRRAATRGVRGPARYETIS